MRLVRLLVPTLLMAVAALALLVACGTPAPTPTVPAAATATPQATPVGPGTQPTATPVPSRDLEAYFRGKTVSIIVPFAPGGGYDVDARRIATYIGRYLPGSPRILIQNRPGGGGLVGAQAMVRANPDGLTFGLINPRQVVPGLLGDELQGFHIDDVTLVAGISEASSAALCVRRDVATTWEGVLQLGRTLTVGQHAEGAHAVEMAEKAGAPVRNIYGYGGVAEILAAVDRREIDATIACADRYIGLLYPEWYDNQFVVPIFQSGSKTIEQDFLQKLGITQAPPHVYDLGINFTQAQRTALEVYDAISDQVARAPTFPKGVPDDILDAWERAFQQVTADPDYIASAVAADRPVGFTPRSELQRVLEATRSLAGDEAEVLRQAFR